MLSVQDVLLFFGSFRANSGQTVNSSRCLNLYVPIYNSGSSQN